MNLKPIEGVKLTDGMVVLLKETYGDTVNERLFRTSGGGFGSHPTGTGKAFGKFIETGEDGYVYRRDIMGIWSGPLPDAAPRYFRKPAGYWVSKMPEVIRTFTGWDRKKHTPAAEQAMYALSKELIQGVKEIDVALQRQRKAESTRDSISIGPSYGFSLNAYIAILRQSAPSKKESIAVAAEGLMELAEAIDKFNEEAPHTNPHGGRHHRHECPSCGGRGFHSDGGSCYRCGEHGLVSPKRSRGYAKRLHERSEERLRLARKIRDDVFAGKRKEHSNPHGGRRGIEMDEFRHERKEAEREGDARPDRVAFRVFPRGHSGPDDMGGDVIALFPDLQWDMRGNITSYMHVGQHGGADPALVKEFRPATPAQYAGLKTELERIGYKLIVIR